MRTRTETITIPTETYEKNTYECEHCDFTTEEEDDAKNHHGLKHAIRDRASIGGTTFLKFESREDFDAYLEAASSEDRNLHEGAWEGPGWYGSEWDSRPCPSGCCSDYYETLTSRTGYERRWKQQIEYLNKALGDLANLK